MARLIDADALLDEFLKRYTERERNGKLVFAACEIKQDFADMISIAPTVDAVEVVRCKDCKYQRKVWIEDKRYKFGGFFCVSCDRNDDIFASHTVDGDDNDFCSYGERKDGYGNG